MRKQTTKKQALTVKDVELLDKMLCALRLLAAVLSTSPSSIAIDIKKRLARKRNKERERFPQNLVPLCHYSYGVEFFVEFNRLVKRFIRNKRLCTDYDRRRLESLVEYTNSELKHHRERRASNATI